MKVATMYSLATTDSENIENQLLELKDVAAKSGWQLTSTFYEDVGISNENGKNKLPALETMLIDAAQGKFDVLMLWNIDRLGCSLQELTGIINKLHSFSIDLYLHEQIIDTTTSSGRDFFKMCNVFAEYERTVITRRVKGGLDKARQRGKTLGRRKTNASIEERIRELRAEGKAILKIAKELGIGTGVVQRVVNEDKTA